MKHFLSFYLDFPEPVKKCMLLLIGKYKHYILWIYFCIIHLGKVALSFLLLPRMIRQFIRVKTFITFNQQISSEVYVLTEVYILIKTTAIPASTFYLREKVAAFMLSYSVSFSSFAVELPIFASLEQFFFFFLMFYHFYQSNKLCFSWLWMVFHLHLLKKKRQEIIHTDTYVQSV